jgi:hypothetical protein
MQLLRPAFNALPTGLLVFEEAWSECNFLTIIVE